MNNWGELTLEKSQLERPDQLFCKLSQRLDMARDQVARCRNWRRIIVINKYLETVPTPPTSAVTHSWCY